MGGMTRGAEPAFIHIPPEGRSPSRNRRLMAVISVAAVVIVAATFAYLLSKPIHLVIAEGSTVGMVEGNFTNLSSTRNPLVLIFNAGTYANQSEAVGSISLMRVFTHAFYDPAMGNVLLFANMTITGRFAANLRPVNLQLTLNETGPLIYLYSDAPPTGTNISLASEYFISMVEQGAATALAGTAQGAGATSDYRFEFGEEFEVAWRPWYNHFVGFRAAVTGPFTPAVEVSILLRIVNTNGGAWP